MKKIIGIILIIVLISCEREAIDGIPSYIKIENINLIDTTDYNNGYNTENITDETKA